jgi:hypothetical protein
VRVLGAWLLLRAAPTVFANAGLAGTDEVV